MRVVFDTRYEQWRHHLWGTEAAAILCTLDYVGCLITAIDNAKGDRPTACQSVCLYK